MFKEVVPKEVRVAIDQHAEGCAIFVNHKKINRGESKSDPNRRIDDVLKDDSCYTEYTYNYRNRGVPGTRKSPAIFTARHYWMSGEVVVTKTEKEKINNV